MDSTTLEPKQHKGTTEEVFEKILDGSPSSQVIVEVALSHVRKALLDGKIIILEMRYWLGEKSGAVIYEAELGKDPEKEDIGEIKYAILMHAEFASQTGRDVLLVLR